MLYESIANATRLQWDWAPHSGPADTVSLLAERLTRLPAEEVLSGDTLIQEPDATVVSSVLWAIRPQNMNAVIVDPDADAHFGDRLVQTLPHYGVKHTVATLEDNFP